MIQIIIEISESLEHPGKCWVEKTQLRPVEDLPTPAEEFAADNIWKALEKLDENPAGN